MPILMKYKKSNKNINIKTYIKTYSHVYIKTCYICLKETNNVLFWYTSCSTIALLVNMSRYHLIQKKNYNVTFNYDYYDFR